jgi:hypothetical protein
VLALSAGFEGVQFSKLSEYINVKRAASGNSQPFVFIVISGLCVFDSAAHTSRHIAYA